MFSFHQRIQHENLLLQTKFLVSFLVRCKSMFVEQIAKRRVNV